MTWRLFGGRGGKGHGVLAFVDLPQDVEVLVPVLAALREEGLEVRVAASRWLRTDHPESLAALTAAGHRPDLVRRREVIAGPSPDLGGVGALITASESSHPAHTAGYALALRAHGEGIATYTLQHGFENVGLIGGEADAYELASERVFCWFPQALAGAACDEVRARLVHAGRPRVDGPGRQPARYAVGVFENLHAERYGEADREAFLAGFSALADTGAPILLRPHPAGRWSAGLDLGRWSNVTLETGGGGRTAVEQSARIITTPSTVVLDAAQAGRPVALASERGEGIDLYRPFPVLRTPGDWTAFAASAEDQAGERVSFLDRVLAPGDAARRIAETVREDLNRRLARR